MCYLLSVSYDSADVLQTVRHMSLDLEFRNQSSGVTFLQVLVKTIENNEIPQEAEERRRSQLHITQSVMSGQRK